MGETFTLELTLISKSTTTSPILAFVIKILASVLSLPPFMVWNFNFKMSNRFIFE
jgi:hypothetical protein